MPGVTDEQPDQPDHRDLPPTLPLPTEPLASFGARARAEAPDRAQAKLPVPPAEPTQRITPPADAMPTAPVVYLAAPPVASAPPAPPASADPTVAVERSPTVPYTPPVASAPPVAPVPPAASTPPVFSATPVASAPVPPAPRVSSAPVPPVVSTPPVAPAGPPPVAPRPAPVTQPAPPRLQMPHTPAPAPRAQPAPPAQPAAGPGPVLVQLGEVRVTSTTIHTPTGDIPLRGSQWAVSDQWHSRQRIPTWAVVCAVLLFFVLCFLSLFFLLAKETRYTGTVQVMITNGNRQYVVRIPVTDQRVVAHIHAQVNYVRSLAAL